LLPLLGFEARSLVTIATAPTRQILGS